ECKKAVDVPPQALTDIGVQPDEIGSFQVFEPAGCRTCNDRGYKGRVALYEVMPMFDSLKELVINGASTAELKNEAIRLGMQTLRMAGIAKLKAGTTSIEEVEGHTAPETTREKTPRAEPAPNAPREGGEGGLRPPQPHPPAAPGCQQPAAGATQDAAAQPGGDQAALLLDPRGRAEAQVRGGERARPLLRREGPLPLPRQPVHAARRGRGGLPDDPLQDPHLPGAGAAAHH